MLHKYNSAKQLHKAYEAYIEYLQIDANIQEETLLSTDSGTKQLILVILQNATGTAHRCP